jgi:hypothetical protein
VDQQCAVVVAVAFGVPIAIATAILSRHPSDAMHVVPWAAVGSIALLALMAHLHVAYPEEAAAIGMSTRAYTYLWQNCSHTVTIGVPIAGVVLGAALSGPLGSVIDGAHELLEGLTGAAIALAVAYLVLWIAASLFLGLWHRSQGLAIVLAVVGGFVLWGEARSLMARRRRRVVLPSFRCPACGAANEKKLVRAGTRCSGCRTLVVGATCQKCQHINFVAARIPNNKSIATRFRCAGCDEVQPF